MDYAHPDPCISVKNLWVVFETQGKYEQFKSL